MILVSNLAQNIYQELTIKNRRVSDADIFLFATKAINYFSNGYYLPTFERETDIVLYPGIYQYALPEDCAYIINPSRPRALGSNQFTHRTRKEFDRWLSDRETSIQLIDGTPYLLANETGGSIRGISSCDDIQSTGGSVSISGDGSDLSVDNVVYQQGQGSLRFTVTQSSGVTTLAFILDDTLDITESMKYGRFFYDLQCPVISTALTSVQLRLKTDDSNYYSFTATVRHRGDSILSGWGAISFDPSTKVETGTVDEANITKVDVILNGAPSGTYRLDSIASSFGVYYLLPYYSIYGVKDSAGNLKESVTEMTDNILVPPGLDGAIEFKTLELLASIRMKDAGLANYFARELQGYEDSVQSQYPRQQKLIQSTYYQGYNKF